MASLVVAKQLGKHVNTNVLSLGWVGKAVSTGLPQVRIQEAA